MRPGIHRGYPQAVLLRVHRLMQSNPAGESRPGKVGATHPAGSARGGLKQPIVLPRRHTRRRGALILFVAAWWGLGLVGLDGGRLTSLQIVLVGLIALVVHFVAGAHRRRTELARDRISSRPVVTPRTCVVLRRFGDEGDHAPPSPWSRN